MRPLHIWMWDMCGANTFCSVLAWTAFFVGGCFAYRRVDARTVVEWLCIAWMLVAADVLYRVFLSFGFVGSPPFGWVVALDQFNGLVCRTLAPAAFTIPISWKLQSSPPVGRSTTARSFVLAINVVAFDILLFWIVLLQQVQYVKRWG